MRHVFLLFLFSSLLFSMSIKQNNNSDLLLYVKKYVSQNYTLKTPKNDFFINPSILRVEDNFAMLMATSLYKDGSSISTEYFEDIVFVLCLEKVDNKWKVIYDLSRNDVPSKKEIKQIIKEFPTNFPRKLLPDFWQEKLN